MNQIIVNQIKPFAAEFKDNSKMILINFINVTIDGTEFDLVPTENVRLEIDIPTREVLNTDGVFAFMSRKGNFIHLSVEELLEIPSFINSLEPIVEECLLIYSQSSGNEVPVKPLKAPKKVSSTEEVDEIAQSEEISNIEEIDRFLHDLLVDKALADNDIALFNKLTENQNSI